MFMRIFLTIIVLIFSFQTWTKADFAKDFEIEGMSIGDSLLDFFTEEEIIKNKQFSQYPNDEHILRNFYKHKNFTTYEMILVAHKKNDKNYIITSLGGSIFYRDNINDCFTKKAEIEKEFDLLFENVEKYSEKIKKNYDKTGNSYSHLIEYEFKNGDTIQITCDDWSKKLSDEETLWDSLNVNIQSSNFRIFLDYAFN